MDYYKQKQFLAQVDKNDRILGKIEKWEAHKKGVLHRGYTCILIYKGSYIFQHRKHPVFDGVFDLSFSSHPLCHPELARPSKSEGRSGISGSDSKKQMLKRAIVLSDRERIQHDKIGLQSMEEAIYEGLKREWNLKKGDLNQEPKFLKKIYYKAKEPNSDCAEHEIDYIYKVELKNLPSPNFDFAYGFSLVEKNKLLTINYQLLTPILAPWAKVIIEDKLI